MKNLRYIFLALSVLAVLAGCRKDPDQPEEKEQEKTDYPYFLYGVAEIDITTDGGQSVKSKETYVGCEITVSGSLSGEDGSAYEMSYSGTGKIRGRGNSTWKWYSKKPYRIKLDESSPFMGMEKNRDFVLLADYRDVTHLMNNNGFTMAHVLDIPYTNHSRYAEVTLNGKNLGLYMVTEQVEEGGHRVDVGGDGGYLLALDVDDGPDYSDASDNFWSSVYGTAVCVKYPDDPTSAQLTSAKSEFAVLENAIKSKDWDEVNKVLDVQSMMDYLMIEEAFCNVEMNNGESIRSGYINKKPDGKWTMGPVWDCDGGYSYNWGDMYDSYGWGHTYFESYKKLIFGTDPYKETGAYGGFPRLFADLFGMEEFVTAYQKRWKEKSPEMLEAVLENINNVMDVTADCMVKDAALWKITNYNTKTEVSKMKTWLKNRFSYLDGIVAAYPVR